MRSVAFLLLLQLLGLALLLRGAEAQGALWCWGSFESRSGHVPLPIRTLHFTRVAMSTVFVVV